MRFGTILTLIFFYSRVVRIAPISTSSKLMRFGTILTLIFFYSRVVRIAPISTSSKLMRFGTILTLIFFYPRIVSTDSHFNEESTGNQYSPCHHQGNKDKGRIALISDPMKPGKPEATPGSFGTYFYPQKGKGTGSRNSDNRAFAPHSAHDRGE